MSRSPRTMVVASGAVACACLAAGLLAAPHLKSPAQAAAEAKPPAASPITARVERRLLTSQLVTRGDVAFAGTVDVRVETGGLTLPPVITGRLPESGATVTEGMVLLEVAGRPVVVLGGDLPTYRSLRPGLSGPDVRQLEQALDRLGHDPGRVDDRYDAATARAVAALFRKAGYRPPEMSEADELRLQTARQRVREARAAVTAAGQAQAEAAEGTSGSERLAWAREDLVAAETELTEAEQAAGTPFPAAEAVFLSGLPRRVDEVRVRTGALVDGPVMTVSGADLVVTAAVTTLQRQVLQNGMAGRLELGSLQVGATVTEIRRRGTSAGDGTGDGAGKAGEFEVVLTPKGLNAEQVTLLRGANVRVVVPITGTDGPVLAVPAAALSAGPDGRSRVEVLRPGGETELVPVDVGLSADGYAEVSPADGSVVEGDQVVIGR